jgi:hypothetical protein
MLEDEDGCNSLKTCSVRQMAIELQNTARARASEGVKGRDSSV